jgi:hypothetical protein
MATAKGHHTTQELVHVKHGRKETLGLQSDQIVKRRKKLRRIDIIQLSCKCSIIF